MAFTSPATNLVAGDTNGVWDVFVHDRLAGTTERVSVDSSGVQGNGSSGIYGVCISKDGRYVAFESLASNLVAGDTNGVRDLFLRDRVLGTTQRVSVNTSGAQANLASHYPSISADDRFLEFESEATNLVGGDTNGVWDVFVRDLMTGTTERVSVGLGGAQSNGTSGGVGSISDDGRFVAFSSDASNLVSGDVNGTYDVFVVDRSTGQTELISQDSLGVQGNSWSTEAALSGDGRFVAFLSNSSNLVPGDTNMHWDVFVRDRMLLTTELVSTGLGGVPGNGDSREPKLSRDGRFVSFTSGASNLVAGDTGWFDVFLRDRLPGTVERMSEAQGGGQATGQSEQASISGDGRYVVFRSSASNLVAGDTNSSTDVFLRDRQASGFTSLCDPGLNNVIACPCGNPASGFGRGCDNSSATGGASLTASGVAYLAQDSLVFTTSDELQSATSVLLQGSAMLSNGAVFGQGVRCAGGILKRLFVKTAVNGSISAPDFGAGEPSVSARSAALGAPIQPGQASFYLVYYRDPIVLAGCAATQTFNATQTGSVMYWP